MNVPSVTLPIDSTDGLSMDPVEARALGVMMAKDYAGADPFPHIVVDDILPDALVQQILVNFPVEKVALDVDFEMGYAGLYKRQIILRTATPSM